MPPGRFLIKIVPTSTTSLFLSGILWPGKLPLPINLSMILLMRRGSARGTFRYRGRLSRLKIVIINGHNYIYGILSVRKSLKHLHPFFIGSQLEHFLCMTLQAERALKEMMSGINRYQVILTGLVSS